MNQFIIQVEKEFNDISVHELCKYDESSVLAGQEYKKFIDTYKTLEDAKEDYPNADVLDYVYTPTILPMSDCPPDWFDEMNAGETW